MSIEPVVGLSDQLPVETPFTDPRLVASHKQDCLLARIEGEGYPPYSVVCAEAELFHVGVARALQRVHMRTPQCRSESLQQFHSREKLILDIHGQRIELRIESRIERDFPSHTSIMIYIAYAVKRILEP